MPHHKLLIDKNAHRLIEQFNPDIHAVLKDKYIKTANPEFATKSAAEMCNKTQIDLKIQREFTLSER